MIKLVDSIEFYKQKDLFIRFAKTFANTHVNDRAFLLYHKKLLENEPELTAFTYQLAFETCYKKKIFNAREIEAVFNNKFKIKDMYNMNGDACDASTVNSAFIVNSLKANNSPFKDIPIQIYNAPLEYQTTLYYNIQEKDPIVKKIVTESKQKIGQSNPDLDIGGRVEDIKHNANVYHIAKNILQPWTYERIEKDFSFFMHDYIHYFKHNILKKNYNTFNRNFYDTLIKIQKEPTMSIYEKNKIWNSLFAQHWYHLDSNIPTPIIWQMTDKVYQPKGNKFLHENIHISSNILDNTSAVRKVVYDAITLLGGKYVRNAEQSTEGILSESYVDSNLDVD